MDFELSEEQKMVKEMCREFAEKELIPVAAELDETGRYPAELVDKMAELGLMGMCVPEEYGGSGFDTVSYVIAVEELCRGCASTGLIMAVNNSLAITPILEWGSEDIKKRYLPKLSNGEMLGCFALTEPNAGSDVRGIRTNAVRDGDYYVVNGSKIFISNAGEADLCVLFAKDRSDGSPIALVVEREASGYKVGKHEKKHGIRACSTCELIFDDVKVPVENLIGSPGQGLKIALKTLDSGRISIGAQAVGISQAAFEEALKYATERKQFGKPIYENQAIQWMLADMDTKINAARLLVYRAAWLKDADKKFSKEAAAAKLFASEISNFVCDKALQIHGGYGYTADYPVERHRRDARITEIYEGTSEIMRIVIARSLLKEYSHLVA